MVDGNVGSNGTLSWKLLLPSVQCGQNGGGKPCSVQLFVRDRPPQKQDFLMPIGLKIKHYT